MKQGNKVWNEWRNSVIIQYKFYGLDDNNNTQPVNQLASRAIFKILIYLILKLPVTVLFPFMIKDNGFFVPVAPPLHFKNL